jgi:hypothetical protein
MGAMAADDWRIAIDFDADHDGTELVEWLRAVELAADEEHELGDRVIVSRDGPRVFLYAGSEERARTVDGIVRARLGSRKVPAEVALTRWHPEEQRWEDANVPLPESEEERLAERRRRREQEEAESRATGAAAWEVRVELPGRRETVELAERLEADGIPVVRRFRYLLVGAASEEDAHALADQLEAEAPAGAHVQVEPGGRLVWEVAPRNPFVVFGGFGV